jgi:5-methyltetrahydrofolate--homocysteine methyltransferase
MNTQAIPQHLVDKLIVVAREQRHDPTPAERSMWLQLRNRRFAHIKFRRQHPVYRFILDFASLRPMLAIEIDGPIHDTTQEYDALRTEVLNILGFEVIRFTNDDVFNNPLHVLTTIDAKIVELLPSRRR